MNSGIFIQSGLAFLEGLALVLSPCILPVLPLVLAGGIAGGRKKPFGIMLGFVVTFAVFALLLRAALAALDVPQAAVTGFSYGIFLLLGLIMLIPELDEKFSTLTGGLAGRAQSVRTGEGFIGGLVMGALIGVVWTPCAGPVLAAATVQVAQSQTTLETVLVIVMFALGSVLPMTAIVLFGRRAVGALGRHTVRIKRGMGAVLMAFALMGIFGFNPAMFLPAETGATQIADSAALVNPLKESYPAPEITGIAEWMNAAPQTLQGLRGKVVLVDFWTYSCINCIRTLPHLRAWYDRYHDKGFEIIGIHTPEFAFEKMPENLRAAIAKYEVKWPVAMDNGYATWNAFKNIYWPAHYLVNREGQVVYTHFGEGQYDVTEHNIRTLLGLSATENLDVGADIATEGQTPETYLGKRRAAREWTGDPMALPVHHWRLEGKWIRTAEFIQSGAAGDSVTLRFKARKIFLVMAPANDGPVEADITVGTLTHRITIDQSRLYELADLPGFGEGPVTVRALSPALRLYAFTFEG